MTSYILYILTVGLVLSNVRVCLFVYRSLLKKVISISKRSQETCCLNKRTSRRKSSFLHGKMELKEKHGLEATAHLVPRVANGAYSRVLRYQVREDPTHLGDRLNKFNYNHTHQPLHHITYIILNVSIDVFLYYLYC